MKKPLLLLLPCLLSLSQLLAQVDTNAKAQPPASPPVQADTAGKTRPPHEGGDTARVHVVRHKLSDSARKARHREDSLAKVVSAAAAASATAARIDSLRSAQTRSDSLARIDSVRRADSIAREAAKPDTALGRAIAERREVIGSNSLINANAPPVTGPSMRRRPESKDTVFYLLVGILFIFALIRIFFEKYFNNLITLFFRVSLRQAQIREQLLQSPLPSLLMNGLFIITGGLYAAYLFHYYRYGVNLNFWLLYLNCMTILGLIYLVKFVVLKSAGWVFNISRATDTYIFVVFLVNKILGICLLPFLILISFSTGTAHEIYITLSIIMVFIFLIYRILASYRPIRHEIKLTPFYFFMYLCAFEIAPLLLIYKVLLTYLEKAS